MSILIRTDIENGGVIGVWNIDEDEDFFLTNLKLRDQEIIEYSSIHDTRKLEWLASRYLVFLLSERATPPLILKDDFGKPYIKDTTWHISLSHTKGMAAVIASPRLVGIDIQIHSSSIEKISTKFLSSPEQKLILAQEFQDDLFHIYWGAKESMYKAYGRKSLQFNEHIIVQDLINTTPNNYQGNGIVKKGETLQHYFLCAQKLGSHYLVYCVEKNYSK